MSAMTTSEKKKKSWEKSWTREIFNYSRLFYSTWDIYLFSQSVIKSHTNEHTDAAKECKLQPSIDSRRKS